MQYSLFEMIFQNQAHEANTPLYSQHPAALTLFFCTENTAEEHLYMPKLSFDYSFSAEAPVQIC